MYRGSFIPGIIWLVITTILLVLPGDDLPSTGLFGIENLDKVVHLASFCLLSFLFIFPYWSRINARTKITTNSFIIAILVIIYGVLMELVQKYWSSGRSFDTLDIAADSLGSILGAIAGNSSWLYKKIGPDRNRGRNQN